MRLQTGTGEAVSKLLHYAVLTAGFLPAMVAAGTDLDKVAVVAGGMGVGLGIGVQSIAGNFVSGLILLFERPLHISDIVTVGSTFGKVCDISIRATTVRTPDGADVIIPTGNLITGEFVNWTLSDESQHSEVSIGVAYGADPERVIHLLEDTALTHERVLRQPAPRAYFTAFGDSSLNFVLRYWVLLQHSVDVNSEVYVAVCVRMEKEGIEIPFPQRDLNLKGIGRDLLASGAAPQMAPKSAGSG